MTRAARWAIVLPLTPFVLGGCSGPVVLDGGPASDGGVDALTQVDSGRDAWSAPDSPPDAFYQPPDAFRPPVEVLYRNETPPTCLDRDQPPRWLADNGDEPEGTVLWNVSLRESRFTMWLDAQRDDAPWWVDAPPSLSGHGIATWFSYNDETPKNWAIGFQGPDGVFANSGGFDFHGLPRIWLPRHDVLFAGSARSGRGMYAPQPKFYPPESTEVAGVDVAGGELWPGGASLDADLNGDMPAWSPTTGDFLAFGARYAMGGERYRGVGAVCEEGTRWFTQLPLYRGGGHVYVRPDGNVLVVSPREAWVLDGQTGELLRSVTHTPEDARRGFPSAYHPGCGVLLEYLGQTWVWLNDDTLEVGPELTLADDRVTNIGGWAGTPDCGLVALGGFDTLYFTRLEADGSVRYSVVFRTPEELGANSAPPISLLDGGTLLITNPLGWVRYAADGEELSRVILGSAVVGGGAAVEPTLAPDGTLYAMGVAPFDEYRFFAASTRAIPGPFLWPHSGYNWARTNSMLPE